MNARFLLSRACPFRAIHLAVRTAICSAILLTTFLGFGLHAQTTYQTQGRWTSPTDGGAHWGHTQIHMALLRGDPEWPASGAFHSFILTWESRNSSGFHGKLFGWNPPTEAVPCGGGFAAAGFTELPLGSQDWPQENIFCSGFSHLTSGALLISGGHEAEATGLTQAVTFDPHAPTGQKWTQQQKMATRRWYPSSTLLPSGNTFVSGGSTFHWMVAWGGQANPQDPASATSDALHHLALTSDGMWESSPTVNGVPPAPRSHHAMASTRAIHGAFENIVVYGGIDAEGFVRSDSRIVQRVDNTSAYGYQWNPMPLQAGSNPPPALAHHTALFDNGTTMWVFGGENLAGVPQPNVYRVTRSSVGQWNWEQQTTQGTENPGARSNHTALYDPVGSRMIVFGGRTTGGGIANDSEVYALSLAGSTLNWTKLNDVGTSRPTPREGHTLILDGTSRARPVGGEPAGTSRRLILFGGRTGPDPQDLKNDLWVLWISEQTGDVEWEEVSVTGAPSARAEHSAIWDRGNGRMVLFGGDPGGTSSEATAHSVTIPTIVTTSAWTPLGTSGIGLAGTNAIWDGGVVLSSKAEIFDPHAGTQWQTPPGNLLQPWYPFNFVLPSGNVFLAGENFVTQKYNVAGSSWSQLGTWPAGVSSYRGGSAVMYGPGEVMKCGTRDVDAGPATGRTSRIVIDVNDTQTSWQELSQMEPRVYHNLTLLPNGKVLVTGGMGQVDAGTNVNVNPKQRPQIWDPSGSGTWTPYTELAADAARRGYHSTSLLLPSGSTVTGGGDEDPTYQRSATIYCPPYLFNGDDGATRPVIDGVPEFVWHDDTLSVCTPDPAIIASACLMRPGAATHAFDMDQRRVDLPIVGTTSSHVLVRTPLNPNYAPPGDYLLFLLDGSGVPSIGRWVTVRSPEDVDACDAVPPAVISTLAPDLIGNDEFYLTWQAPADDGVVAASGAAVEYDLRRWGSPINTEPAWGNALQLGGEPAPAHVNTEQGYEDRYSGLQPCTKYYYALRARDDRPPNLSGLYSVWAKTLCSAGGGGGVEGADNQFELASQSGDRGIEGAAPEASLAAPTGALVVESEPVSTTRWRFTLRRLSSMDSADQKAVLSQTRDVNGAWETKQVLQSAATSPLLGVCVPGGASRRVFPGDYELTRVASTVQAFAGTLALVTAAHSSQGPLENRIWSGQDGVSLQSGETLELTYEAQDLSSEPEGNWFALVRKVEGQSAPSREELAEGVGETRLAFALWQNQPNPTQGATVIRYDLPNRVGVLLTIYDIAGRKVRTLVHGEEDAGRHAVEWDQRDDAGVRLAPGAYVYRILAGEFREERKIVLLP